jgi:hypothetical protein
VPDERRQDTLAFYDFPLNWTTNPLEPTFATIRLDHLSHYDAPWDRLDGPAVLDSTALQTRNHPGNGAVKTNTLLAVAIASDGQNPSSLRMSSTSFALVSMRLIASPFSPNESRA